MVSHSPLLEYFSDPPISLHYWFLQNSLPLFLPSQNVITANQINLLGILYLMSLFLHNMQKLHVHSMFNVSNLVLLKLIYIISFLP